MKLYSDIPTRRLTQVVADVLVVLWVVLWVRVAGASTRRRWRSPSPVGSSPARARASGGR